MRAHSLNTKLDCVGYLQVGVIQLGKLNTSVQFCVLIYTNLDALTYDKHHIVDYFADMRAFLPNPF